MFATPSRETAPAVYTESTGGKNKMCKARIDTESDPPPPPDNIKRQQYVQQLVPSVALPPSDLH